MRGRVSLEVARQRENDVWRLRSEGRSYMAIAEAVGISHETVRRILKRVTDRVMADTKAIAEAVRVEHLEKYDVMMREAFDAWNKSKEPRKKIVKTSAVSGRPDKDGKGRPVSETSIQQFEDGIGEPRFLELFMKAMEGQQKLVGIDPSVTHTIKWQNALPPGVNVSDVEDAMDKVARLLLVAPKKEAEPDEIEGDWEEYPS